MMSSHSFITIIKIWSFQTVIGDPLPATLAGRDEITKDERFKTTTGVVHDNKHSGGPYGNQDPRYKKAPGHWKVHFVKDLHEKVGTVELVKEASN